MNSKNNFKPVLSLIAIAGFVFLALSSGDSKSDRSSRGKQAIEKVASEDNESSSEQRTEEDEYTVVEVGQPLETRYFAITVNKVTVSDRVRTGNQFFDLPREEGNKYLIINATFKNIDNESRMIMEGSVLIGYKGDFYEYDKTEMIMAEGFGTMLDQINPLVSKTTKIVYKLPEEITGIALWQPGRSGSKEFINLGNIE